MWVVEKWIGSSPHMCMSGLCQVVCACSLRTEGATMAGLKESGGVWRIMRRSNTCSHSRMRLDNKQVCMGQAGTRWG